MYLLIGTEQDLCCAMVHERLRARGADVCLTPEPFVGDHRLVWSVATDRVASALALAGRPAFNEQAWSGVLVRGHGAPLDPRGWSADDYAYICAEAQAALLAWLHTLHCPVVNRLSPDLWYMARRSFLEWRPLLLRVGLPVPCMRITNDLQEAQSFAKQWGGRLVYLPLTAQCSYPVASDAEWAKLAHLMTYLPVALVEPLAEPVVAACVAGEAVYWSSEPPLVSGQCGELEQCLRRFARSLGLDFVQVELCAGAQGLCCVAVQLFPRFETYPDPVRQQLCATVVGLLAGELGGGGGV